MRMVTTTPRRRQEGGAAAVEFALIFAFVLVPTVLGILQYGWYFYSSQVTSSATREAARRLTVGDCQTGTAAQSLARNHSGFSTMTLTYGTPAASTTNTLPAAGQVLRVRASVDGGIISFLPLPNGGQITRTVDARVEDTTQDTACP
jgi:Flp pilus assembly protein TadG